MLCPGCDSFFWPSQILRKNVKSLDGVDIAYDVHCPYCRTLAGRMFWGKLLPAQTGAQDGAAEAPGASAADTRDAAAHKSRSKLRRQKERRTRERRSGDRRGEDRRTQSLPFPNPEARKGERRQVDRRAQDRRQNERRLNDRRDDTDAAPVVAQPPEGERPSPVDVAPAPRAAETAPPTPDAAPGNESGNRLNVVIGEKAAQKAETPSPNPKKGGTTAHNSRRAGQSGYTGSSVQSGGGYGGVRGVSKV